MYDYANILFSGRACNIKCYDCIGKHDSLKGLPSNVNTFPLMNIDSFLEKVNEHSVPDLAFTGTNVDPQLYRHEPEFIEYVKERLNPNTNLSLHTNGLLVLRDIDVFNSYDKASISFPSFNIDTFQKVTQSRKQPDIRRIIDNSKIPLKLSMLITPFNTDEIEDYIRQSLDLGINRIVVRKLKGREEEFLIEQMSPFNKHEPIKEIFGWGVYNINGAEVTICDFNKSTARGLFLFSDGRLEDKLI